MGNVDASADVITVTGLNTSASNGNVDLRSASGLVVVPNVVLTTGTGTLSLAAGLNADGTGNSGQNGVSVNVQDFGFEQPVVGSGPDAFVYNPSGTPWAYSGTSSNGSGVSGNGSPVTANNPNAPQGNQVAILQQQSSISQTIDFAAGTYSISFLAAQASPSGTPGNQTIQVEVDGVVVDAFTPTDMNYASFTTDAIALTEGVHTIAFVGLSDDFSIGLIDAVTINGIDGSGGILTISQGATVVSDNAGGNAITLRGADIDMDLSGAPVTVGGHPIANGGTPTGHPHRAGFEHAQRRGVRRRWERLRGRYVRQRGDQVCARR